MANDEEDFVFYGTPIGREEEFTSRKKKAVAEASGQLRTALPPWKQEVKTTSSNIPKFLKLNRRASFCNHKYFKLINNHSCCHTL